MAVSRAGTEVGSFNTASTPQLAGLGLGVAGPASGLQVQGGAAAIGTRTVTFNQPALNVDQTWNNAGITLATANPAGTQGTLAACAVNVTPTAGSGYLELLSIGGVPSFGVGSDGSFAVGFSQTSDVVSPTSTLIGPSAFGAGITNPGGGNLIVGGGLGAYGWNIINVVGVSGEVFTVVANGVTKTFTAGVDFTHSNTGSVEATNLQAAINAASSAAFPVGSVSSARLVPLLGCYSLSVSYTGSGTVTPVNNSASGVVNLVTNTTWSDAKNLAFGTTTGTQIGTSTSQKIGFYGTTPVVQITGATDVLAGLVTQGLRAASSNPPLNLGSGALAAGASTLGATTVSTLGTAGNVTLAAGNNIVIATSTGTQIGTGTTQLIGFYGATPTGQISGSTDVLAGLVTQGLRAATSNPPLNLGTGTLTCGTLSPSGKVSTYNGISTAGWGVDEIVAQANVTAQSAANSSIVTVTNSAADGNYEVCMTCNVTAAGTLSAPLQCVYTDVNNASQTITLPVQKAGGTGGTFLTSGLMVATGDYATPTMSIRVKASTSITLKTGTGTYTSVTYSASGVIKRTS